MTQQRFTRCEYCRVWRKTGDGRCEVCGRPLTGETTTRDKQPPDVTITADFLDEGSNCGAGWTKQQARLLGVKWPLKKGWARRAIGKKISLEKAHRFLEIRRKDDKENNLPARPPRLKEATGANWKPPTIPAMPRERRETDFLDLVDTAGGEVFDVERWHAPAFVQGVQDAAYDEPFAIFDPKVDPEVAFGKHKGKRFSELADGYLEWMLGTDIINPWWGQQVERAKAELTRRQETDCHPLDRDNLAHLREIACT